MGNRQIVLTGLLELLVVWNCRPLNGSCNDKAWTQTGWWVSWAGIQNVLWKLCNRKRYQHRQSLCGSVSMVSWGVYVHLLGTVRLHRGLLWDIWKAVRSTRGAVAKVSLLVHFQHLGESQVGEDTAGVDQSIKHLGCLLNQVTPIGVVSNLFFIRLQVWMGRHLLIESSETEFVLNVVFLPFTEEHIATEPIGPVSLTLFSRCLNHLLVFIFPYWFPDAPWSL